jgi:hypothetical protein
MAPALWPLTRPRADNAMTALLLLLLLLLLLPPPAGALP